MSEAHDGRARASAHPVTWATAERTRPNDPPANDAQPDRQPPDPRARRPGPRTARPHPWWRMLTACVLGAIVALQWSYLLRVGLWSFIDPRSSRFMDNEAARLAQLAPPRRLAHTWVDYQRISVHLKRAVIAAEDARFVDHAGFDWEAIRKAFTANFYRGSHPRGGSTITQQLAKNLFLTPERSYLRKAQEAVITAMIEALWSKRRILEVYLNLVEWGDGIFGAEAAARHYGGITAAQLGPEQAARMAALLPRPRFFDRHPGVPFIAERTADIARTMPFARIP